MPAKMSPASQADRYSRSHRVGGNHQSPDGLPLASIESAMRCRALPVLWSCVRLCRGDRLIHVNIFGLLGPKLARLPGLSRKTGALDRPRREPFNELAQPI